MLPTSKIGALISPFFYQDDDHTFFVEPTLTETTILQAEDYGIPSGSVLDDLIVDEIWAEIPIWIDPGDPGWVAPIDSSARFQLQRRQDWLTNPATVVQFDESLVGPGGGLDFSVSGGAVNL